MIENHHLAYAGVLLVFLTGAAVVALAAFLFLATGVLAVGAVRIIKPLATGRLPGRAQKGRKALEPPLSMEEALRQVAAGKASSTSERPRNGQGNTVPISPKYGSRRPDPHRCDVTARSRHSMTARAKTAA